jgi:hypothetical protein
MTVFNRLITTFASSIKTCCLPHPSATNNLFYSLPEDLLSPISLTTRLQSGNTLGWSQNLESVNINGEGTQEVRLARGTSYLILTLSSTFTDFAITRI